MVPRTIFNKISILGEYDYTNTDTPILKRNPDTIITTLTCLSLNGPSTTYDLARFFLKHTSNVQKNDRTYHVPAKARMFSRVIDDRPDKNPKTKEHKIYPGLISNDYVKFLGKISGEKRLIDQFFLTLKGSFFVLGIKYLHDDETLKIIIPNLAKNHIFFAYVNSVLEQTDIKFVKEIFIKPIRNVIYRGRIFKYDDFEFYFPNLAQSIYEAVSKYIYKIRNLSLNENKSYLKFKLFNNMQNLIKNTYYDSNLTTNYGKIMYRKFYSKKEQNFFLNHCDIPEFEFSLLERVMRDVHIAYHNVWDLPTPSKSKNFPRQPKKLKSPNKSSFTALELLKFQSKEK